LYLFICEAKAAGKILLLFLLFAACLILFANLSFLSEEFTQLRKHCDLRKKEGSAIQRVLTNYDLYKQYGKNEHIIWIS